MKNILLKNSALVFIYLISVILIAGCGSNPRMMTGDYGEEDSKINVKDDTSIIVGLSQIGSESDWRMASTKSVQDAFSAEEGYDLIFDDAQQKQENQLKALREFIDQGVDYIVLDPIVETGWDSVLIEAKEAGIPVIIYDRRVKVDDDSLYTCWVGSDFKLEGARTCAWLNEYFLSKGIDQDINIVDIQGTPGASAQIGRSEALNEAVNKNRSWTLLAADSGDFTTAKGKEVMNAMLRQFGDKINVVYVENDNMAYGAIEMIKKRGYKVGCDIESGDIMVVSFDSSRTGLKMTLDGEIAVDTECNPLYGPRLVEIIDALEAGEKVEKETYIEEEQFSGISYIGTIQVEGKPYKVTSLTPELIAERKY